MIEAGDLAQVVHRAQVGVLDGGGPRLPVEALDDGRPVVRAEVRHLEGDPAVQLGVLGQVDGAHTALTHLLQDAVAAELLRQDDGRGHDDDSATG